MEISYVLFRRYFQLHQAEMDLNTLKNAGVEAYLTDKTMGSFSYLGAATGGVKLHVAEKDLEKAQVILAEGK